MYRAACIAWLVAFAAAAFADGAFVVRGNEWGDIREPEQKAVIWWHDGIEDLILNASYAGAPQDFAWIIPVPARPEVEEFSGAIFHELTRLTHVEAKQQGTEAMGIRTAGEEQVTLVERKEVGPYDVAVLTATGANALTNWLQDNGYQFPSEHADVLDHYTRGTWHFVAMRIMPEKAPQAGALAEGSIASVRLTFPRPHAPFYPLRITSINPGETAVLLYLIGDKRYGPAAPKTFPGRAFREEFCGHLRLKGPAHPTVAALLGPGAEFVLTKLRAPLRSQEMVDDLLLEVIRGTPKLGRMLSHGKLVRTAPRWAPLAPLGRGVFRDAVIGAVLLAAWLAIVILGVLRPRLRRLRRRRRPPSQAHP